MAVRDGPHDFGETVDGDVYFQNAGVCEITFYVEFVVDHFDSDYEDSNAPHGSTVTLSPGQWGLAKFEWKVSPVAPSGYYDAYAEFYDADNVRGADKPSTPVHTELDDTGFEIDETPANTQSGWSNRKSNR